MQTRNLPNEPAEAVRLLAQEVNRLSGEVAGLMAFIQAAGLDVQASKDDLLTYAHQRLAPQLKPQGPFTETDHASITIAELTDGD